MVTFVKLSKIKLRKLWLTLLKNLPVIQKSSIEFSGESGEKYIRVGTWEKRVSAEVDLNFVSAVLTCFSMTFATGIIPFLPYKPKYFLTILHFLKALTLLLKIQIHILPMFSTVLL